MLLDLLTPPHEVERVQGARGVGQLAHQRLHAWPERHEILKPLPARLRTEHVHVAVPFFCFSVASKIACDRMVIHLAVRQAGRQAGGRANRGNSLTDFLSH